MENGTQQLGKYTLRQKIATGGMAEIWLSEQQGPGGFTKELVIKRILPHLASDARFVEMFLDEARLAAKLSHPNIVQIYDLGEADGSYFIAMEYIKGNDLEGIINQCNAHGERIDPPMAARIMADACAALDYAHSFADGNGNPLNLVHRDISPQNILVSEKGVVKLVDFGVAKAASSSHVTQAGAVKGKFCYMSPEQIASKPLDGRSDLFAMGIVLYELLTGRRPFGHESDMMAVTAILNQPPPPPQQFGAQLPQGLESVLFRSLEKDPNRRFQSADAFQTALEHYLSTTGVLVRTKELAHYMAGLFGDGPRRSGTQLAGPALADTQLSDGFAAAPGGPGSQSAAQPRPTGQATGPAGPPQSASAPAPVSVGAASQPQPAAAPSNPHQLVASPHAEETRSLTPGAPASEPSSRGIGPGLIVILVFVLAALAGGGYMLVTMLGEQTGNEDAVVSESDAGEDAGSEEDRTAEEDGHIAQGDTGAATDTANSDTSNPDLSTSDTAASSLPTGDAQSEDLADDTAVAQTDTSADDTKDESAETVEPGDTVAAEIEPTSDITEESDTATASTDTTEQSTEDTTPEDTAEQDTAQEDTAQQDTPQADAVEEDTAQEDTAEEVANAADTEQQDTAATEEVAESDTGTTQDTRRRDRRRDERPGRLTVTAAPPGRYVVLLGDEELGSTPLRNHELPPGRHRITVRSADGSLEETRRVRIRPARNESEFFDFRD